MLMAELYLDEDVTAGMFNLIEQQRSRIENAIKIAEDFKAGNFEPLPKLTISEDDLATEVQKLEDEFNALNKEVKDKTAELQEVRTSIASKSGVQSPHLKKAPPMWEETPNEEAQKWLDENFGGIRKSIREQSEKLKATLELAEQCEKSVSRLAQLRTKRVNFKNRNAFIRTALGQLRETLQAEKEKLAKL